MSEERVVQILEAAYQCFKRHGVRRTTMDDIAAEAGMSRPAVYQYVRNKDDVTRRLVQKILAENLHQAAEVGSSIRPLEAKLLGILAAKLELTLRLYRESPHAAEMLDVNARLFGDLVQGHHQELAALLTRVVTDAVARGEADLGGGTDAGTVAEIALALLRGLEADLGDLELPHRRLRDAVRLLARGLAPRVGTPWSAARL
ncbi:MAG TPA: helix-turn-helix domain-containing protein [Cryptosporangiaceae bacterium]|nr:helix-turn-helix domain-containing protein [Cryptosporangiaceae bacterium]